MARRDSSPCLGAMSVAFGAATWARRGWSPPAGLPAAPNPGSSSSAPEAAVLAGVAAVRGVGAAWAVRTRVGCCVAAERRAWRAGVGQGSALGLGRASLAGLALPPRLPLSRERTTLPTLDAQGRPGAPAGSLELWSLGCGRCCAVGFEGCGRCLVQRLPLTCAPGEGLTPGRGALMPKPTRAWPGLAMLCLPWTGARDRLSLCCCLGRLAECCTADMPRRGFDACFVRVQLTRVPGPGRYLGTIA